jgi:hypothetical protein
MEQHDMVLHGTYLNASLAPDMVHVLGEQLDIHNTGKDDKGAASGLSSINGSLSSRVGI